MTLKPLYMTELGFARVSAQLERLRNERLPEVSELLTDAFGGGDLLDNTEFLLLRSEFDTIEYQIWELENILKNAQLIARGEPDGTVHLGDTVLVQIDGDLPETYQIVGSLEADPLAGTISNECPLGAALLGRAIGDEMSVATPEGEKRFRLIAVS